MISQKEVKHISKLARLGLTEKEIKKFQKELSSILDYIEKLKEVDVSNTKPFSVKLENVFREDSIKPKEKEKLLEMAPEKKEGYFKVKSILK